MGHFVSRHFKGNLLVALLVFAGLAFSSCLKDRGDDIEADGGNQDCAHCHELPPDDAHMGCDSCHPFPVTTGAHGVHIFGGEHGQILECSDCHTIPQEWFDEGHLNAVVEVTFPEGIPVNDGSLDPHWDGYQCFDLYCHGASLTGGTDVAPHWNGAPRECDSCHGNPPPSPHPEEVQPFCSALQGGRAVDLLSWG